MKITENSGLRPSNRAARKKDNSSTTAADEFLNILTSDPATATTPKPPPSDISAVTTMNTLLSLQEMPEEEVRNRKALMHGKATLETLEQLRHALLLGNVPQHVLKNLHRMVHEQKLTVSDPKLTEIMEDIELRAAVELAKLELATQQ